MPLHEISVSAPPAAEPVLIADMKDWIKVDFADDDTIITALIVAARFWAEGYTNRAFITQTLFSYFTENEQEMHIPRPPIQSITKVETIRQDDTQELTKDSDYFEFGVDDLFIRVERSEVTKNARHPRERLLDRDLKVTAVHGYGNAGTDVPESILTGIKMIVAHSYEHRGDGGKMEVPAAARFMLDPFKIIRLG